MSLCSNTWATAAPGVIFLKEMGVFLWMLSILVWTPNLLCLNSVFFPIQINLVDLFCLKRVLIWCLFQLKSSYWKHFLNSGISVVTAYKHQNSSPFEAATVLCIFSNSSSSRWRLSWKLEGTSAVSGEVSGVSPPFSQTSVPADSSCWPNKRFGHRLISVNMQPLLFA